MRTLWNILGVILACFGALWILQGVNVIQRGFMAGHTKWAVYGAIVLVAGVAILLLANRKRPGAAPPA